MKKNIKTICLLSVFTIASNAQNVFPIAISTNVGIGTVRPANRLEVVSATANTSGVRITNLTSNSPVLESNGKVLSVDKYGDVILVPDVSTAGTNTNIYNSDGTLLADRTVTMAGKNLTINPSLTNSQFFINGSSGNVGLGTLTPVAKLDVKGKISGTSGSFASDLSNGIVFVNNTTDYSRTNVLSAGTIVDANNSKTLNFFDFPQSNYDPSPWVYFNIQNRNDVSRFSMHAVQGGFGTLTMSDKTQQTNFQIQDDGNNKTTVILPKVNSFLGIGTSSFTDGTDIFRLSVKGNIRAERIKVYTTWADFVFDKDYNLPTLKDVEIHIKENGHLKDIPSAKEVDCNGLDLGDINKKLLQKVEELTLYLIEMNKEIQEMKVQIKK